MSIRRLLFCLLWLGGYFSLSAQVGAAITDPLVRWGLLVDRQQIVGYYCVTARADERQEVNIFTVTLYSSSLQPVGSKVYPADKRLAVHDVAYNGTHLGVLLYGEEGEVSRLDVLDAEAKTVGSYPLAGQYPDADGNLFAANDGFLAVNSFPVIPGRTDLAKHYLIEKIVTEGEGKGWTRRFGTDRSDVNLAIDSEELRASDDLVLRLWYKRGNKVTNEVHFIDPATGGNRFVHSLPEQKIKRAAGYLAAARVDGGYQVLRVNAEYLRRGVLVPNTLDIITYDAAGQLVAEQPISVRALVAAELRDAGLAPLRPNTQFIYRVGLITPSGSFSLVAEPYARVGKGHAYDTPYVLALDRGGRLLDFAAVTREPLVVPFVVSDLNFMQQLRQHGGPFCHALSYAREGDNYHYLLDREYRATGVTYHGINQLHFDGEQLRHEYIPLKAPDLVRLFPARAGYLGVLEAVLADSRIVPRLEKLTE